MSYKSFDLLEKLYFVRTGGSKEELKAAEIINIDLENKKVELSIRELEGTSDELVDESSEKEGEVKENV